MPMNPEFSAVERQSLVDELSQMSDRLVSITVQVAGAYGKTQPITKEADDATRAVRKLIYALEDLNKGTRD